LRVKTGDMVIIRLRVDSYGSDYAFEQLFMIYDETVIVRLVRYKEGLTKTSLFSCVTHWNG